MLKRRSVLAATAGWTIVGASAVRAQTWPSQQVKIVVPYIPGGATDTAGRVVAEKMTLAARPAGDRRESRRRQHHHRHGAGRQVQARRPHLAARHDDAGDQRRARPQAALRSAEGLPADLDAGRHSRPVAFNNERAGAALRRVRRMGEQAAAEGALRHVGRRQPAASVGRAVRDPQQAQHGDRRLQGRGRRHCATCWAATCR